MYACECVFSIPYSVLRVWVYGWISGWFCFLAAKLWYFDLVRPVPTAVPYLLRTLRCRPPSGHQVERALQLTIVASAQIPFPAGSRRYAPLVMCIRTFMYSQCAAAAAAAFARDRRPAPLPDTPTPQCNFEARVCQSHPAEQPPSSCCCGTHWILRKPKPTIQSLFSFPHRPRARITHLPSLTLFPPRTLSLSVCLVSLLLPLRSLLRQVALSWLQGITYRSISPNRNSHRYPSSLLRPPPVVGDFGCRRW